ncbi:unnamed protein product [Nippostrongylus brasiliensis]|uniref:DUF4817 domain-containing protein n=1 Tax=Nippostrongylus brasiliensis TaxID=27835 RepID=A0A0N4XDN2_NIPBR|nr:unnamed protein product [Nippostrongylus brasiliensis]
METVNIKKKATQFQPEEAALLVRLYVENYAEYNSKFTSGGRVGKSVREVFHEQWADAVSSLGFASRSKHQIDERIRNERKRHCGILIPDSNNHTYRKARKPVLCPMPSVNIEEDIIEEEPQAIPQKRKRSYASITRENVHRCSYSFVRGRGKVGEVPPQ